MLKLNQLSRKFLLSFAACLLGLISLSCQDESSSIGESILNELKNSSCEELTQEEIFNRQVLPLIHEGKEPSCARCHLPGVDLRSLIQFDECNTFSCLSDEKLINVSVLLESKILDWILRGHQIIEKELAEDPVTLAEYKAFVRWIGYQSMCNRSTCGEASRQQCLKEEDVGPMTSDEQATMIILPDISNVETCSDSDFVVRFIQSVWPDHGRCYHCHSDYYSRLSHQSPQPSPWMSDDRGIYGALETTQRILNSSLIDLSRPTQSLILLKPLVEEAGGLAHGGGAKMSSTNDELYLKLLNWITYVAECAD